MLIDVLLNNVQLMCYLLMCNRRCVI